MAIDWAEALGVITRFIGRAVCHQMDDRSAYVGGRALPLCARCTGMYFGTLASIAYIFLRKRLGGSKPPSVAMAVLACLGMLPLMADGVSSYLGLRETGNSLRYITGVLFTYMLPVLFVAVINFRPGKENPAPVLRRGREMAYILLLGLMPLSLLTQDMGYIWLWGVMSLMCAAAVAVVVTGVFYLVLSFFIKRRRAALTLAAVLGFLFITGMSLINERLLAALRVVR